jgi:fatty-acid desaturase
MEEIKCYRNEIQRFELDRNSMRIARLMSLLGASDAEGTSEKIRD